MEIGVVDVGYLLMMMIDIVNSNQYIHQNRKPKTENRKPKTENKKQKFLNKKDSYYEKPTNYYKQF